MAVYNGFSTRKKEAVYNELTFELIKELQAQVLANFNAEEFDPNKWTNGCKKVLRRMHKLEKEKFMPPKYSEACTDLVSQLGIKLSPRMQSLEKDFPGLQSNSYLVSIAKASKKIRN